MQNTYLMEILTMIMTKCNGDFELRSCEEIERKIIESSKQPFDDIWFYLDAEYPCLSILVNGQYACVHYFLNNDDICQSVGYGSEDISFECNGEKSNVPADAIISLDLAIECAKQFFETHGKPTYIEWRKL